MTSSTEKSFILENMYDLVKRFSENVDVAKHIYEMIESGEDLLSVRKEDGKTPLYMAASIGSVEFCRYLIEQGADVNERNTCCIPYTNIKSGDLPLHIAAMRGHLNVCKLLVKSGCEPYATNNKGETPLLAAASRGHTDVCKFLINRGAEVNSIACSNGLVLSPLHLAAWGGHTETCKFLLEHGAKPLINYIGNGGNSPLYHATACNKVETVKLLLKYGAKIDIPDMHNTVINVAVGTENQELLQLLLDNGANVNAKNNCGFSALHVACTQGILDCCRKLIECGANVNDITQDKETPLTLAATRWCLSRSSNYLAICEELLAHGAKVNVKNDKGNSPLHQATWCGQEKIADLLLSHGAVIEDKNKNGETPLCLATQRNNREVCKLLIKQGANVNAVDNNGETILHKLKDTRSDTKWFKGMSMLLTLHGAKD